MWQGAEAKIRIVDVGVLKTAEKWRFPKKYRHPDLDSRLTRQRTGTEARALARALHFGLPVPAVYMVVPERGIICMEYIEDSLSLKEVLWKGLADFQMIVDNLSEIVANLHLNDMIHGDLTTSNFLYQTTSSKVFLIDFGLAGQSSSVEDKAVDLYVLERAIKATHSVDHPDFFSTFIRQYFSFIKEKGGERACDQLQKRFEEVRVRGRKRE